MRVGTFRTHPRHPRFHDSGPIIRHVFVFPRTAVRIAHADRAPFIATLNLVTYYNRGELYRRDVVDPSGDQCEWFAVQDETLVELLAAADPAVRDHPDRPFDQAVGPSDASAYVMQRLVSEHAAALGPRADRLAVEDTTFRVLGLLQYRLERSPRPLPPSRAHRDLVERLKQLLGTRFAENLSLAEIAAALGCSSAYLSRLFQRVEGSSIHQFRLQLRLRRSLELVAGSADLAAVASELGFATHSHFSSAFHRCFGLTPSQFRAAGRALRRGHGELPSKVPLAIAPAAPGGGARRRHLRSGS